MLSARNVQPRGPVLRQSPFGDIQSGKNLYSRDQRLRQNVGGRGRRPQQAVDAHPNAEAIAHGSIWMSLARRSIALSRRSLTARTTGAPLARSRRLSMLSSTPLGAESALDPPVSRLRRSGARTERPRYRRTKRSQQQALRRGQSVRLAGPLSLSGRRARDKFVLRRSRKGNIIDSRRKRDEKRSAGELAFNSSRR